MRRCSKLPEVLAVVKQIAFSSVVCTRTGHDAVAATGLLLYNPPQVAKRYQPHRHQIWRLTARESILGNGAARSFGPPWRVVAWHRFPLTRRSPGRLPQVKAVTRTCGRRHHWRPGF